jgi:hydrogenase maturation protein HypF
LREFFVSANEREANRRKERLRIVLRGAVQGVGFRPFVYRLATEMKLFGWVNNSSQGVFIEVEGDRPDLDHFLSRLQYEKPPRSFIQSLESSFLDSVGYESFEVRPSDEGGPKTALVLPDIATCPDCLKEIFDPQNRRYLYPFTNCTNCGPRFTIIEDLPYDRRYTTMKIFPMCENCRSEYENPSDRRFHAQPNACPECGPYLELWDGAGKKIDFRHNALLLAAAAIRQGKIVAIKGIGGFHLMVDARDEEAVKRLRERKEREEKPLALMYPSLEIVKAHCQVSEGEERLLLSPEAPIVLLKKKATNEIAASIAPGNPYLGVMLPYSPLHHLLLNELGFPVVATSGNRSEEPICIDENQALLRLSGIADLLLVHNRPIVRHVDDSIVRLAAGRELVMRRARGFAPLPAYINTPAPAILAVGAHLKNTVAISMDKQVVISQHIGDLETAQAFDAFSHVIDDLSRLYDIKPVQVASDLHPDYLSTKYAQKRGIENIAVQHHYAHIMSCMAENEIEAPVLGVSWDGTGLGIDNTIWGGEFLRINDKSFERFGHFRQFRLPGGEKAVVEPCRAALGVLFEIFGSNFSSISDLPTLQAFDKEKLSVITKMLEQGLNSPVTSSAGRLFDAVSSIIGMRQVMRYEGQAAMELEFAIGDIKINESYPFEAKNNEELVVVNWERLILSIVDDYRNNVAPGLISAKFHNSMAEIIVECARQSGGKKIVLSGGCFQNKYLLERSVDRLTQEGFRPYFHQRIPPNDGGIALGQIMAALRQKE